ncbi:MAG: aminotransferase class V-fold PLP-dependent enzyme [Cytophagaceae bacterium]
MITFYPGPSKLFPEIKGYLAEAYDSGILSFNHRTTEFMLLYKQCEALLKSKLNIPEDYAIYFCSSATECWEVISQSYNVPSLYFYNGSFGEKWFNSAKKINTRSFGNHFSVDAGLNTDNLTEQYELIGIVQNETSNGTHVNNSVLEELRNRFKGIIAVDCTSSLGGIKLNIAAADIWFASVQKCFGLPSGMALMICSPSAIQKAKEIKSNRYYNDILALHENYLNYQTTHTPNILNIYLLKKVMEQSEGIDKINKHIHHRAVDFYNYTDSLRRLKPMVADPDLRSQTVFALQGDAAFINSLKEDLRKQNIIAGNGYGQWKENTIRIANFPAIKDEEFEILKSELTKLAR